jgi:rhodanese-related sulfurtransferase
MITGNPEKAREFFAAKMAFTTGPFEVKGMLDRKEGVTVIECAVPRTTRKATSRQLLLRCSTSLRPCRSPGAVNLPHGQWHTAKGLSKDKLNILYCYSQTCHLAAAAALELASQGYRVMEMEGGFAAWTAGNNAIEGIDCACDTAA